MLLKQTLFVTCLKILKRKTAKIVAVKGCIRSPIDAPDEIFPIA